MSDMTFVVGDLVVTAIASLYIGSRLPLIQEKYKILVITGWLLLIGLAGFVSM